MRNAPFSLSATLMLAVFLCLGNTMHGQNCSWTYCLEDPTCSDSWQSPCAAAYGNCASYAFNAPCTGTYTLVASSRCDHDCHDCEVCMSIVKVPGGIVMASCQSFCAVQDCSDTCSVTLQKGQPYFLYVCKTPCDDSTCEECSSTGCRALGCICTEPSSGQCAP